MSEGLKSLMLSPLRIDNDARLAGRFLFRNADCANLAR
jgi:hypothetical protein